MKTLPAGSVNVAFPDEKVTVKPAASNFPIDMRFAARSGVECGFEY